MRQIKEKMVTSNGKLLYGISLDEVKDNSGSNHNSTHITMERGQIQFSSGNWYNTNEYNFSDETHRIAKEIFITQLQADVKVKLYELKQLEEVLETLGLGDILGNNVEQITSSLWQKAKMMLPSGGDK